MSRTNVASLNGSLGCSETQSNVLIPSSTTLADLLALRFYLRVGKDVRLLLERTLRLDGQLCRHVCYSNVGSREGVSSWVVGNGGCRGSRVRRRSRRDFESALQKPPFANSMWEAQKWR